MSQGLALSLTSGFDHEIRSFSNFYIDVTLTKKGLENFQSVIEAVFQFAQIVRDKGVQDYVFNEVKRVGEINFEFAEKSGA